MKKFKEVWPIIKFPVIILVLWNVLSIIIANVDAKTHATIFSTIPSIVVLVIVYAYIGYVIIDEHKRPISDAARSGAWAGGIVGLVGAILALISFNLFPEMYATAIADAIAQNPQLSEEMLIGWMKISMYVNIVLAPIFGALISAGISALSAWSTKKFQK